MERGIDRGRARVEVEGRVRQVADHLVFVLDPAVELLEAAELVHVEGREAVELDRAHVAARALYPQDLDGFAGERVLLHDLGGGVAAAVIGDAFVRAQKVGAIDEPFGLGHAGGLRIVP
jgi:hypothetical protein